MDSGPHTPNRTPAAGTVAEPFRDRPALADTFLSPPQAPDEVGRLAHYRVLAELGRGGMGVVYRAEDTELGRPVAVKVMLPDGAADARARARFRREAEAQAQVDHPHVASIYSVGETNGVAFLVMPLLRGTSLAAALKLTPKPPLTSVVRIGREIAEGLAAAHELGLIHRDIKPGNIWLEAPKWRVKILDFGLARVSGEGATAISGQPLTATGAIMGTPAYMSPEQARTQPTDYRSDLFSLGVVLYQMATGGLPFTGANTFDVLTATVSHHPPAAHEVNPAVPLALSELIWRLMAKGPAERPPSAAAVAEQLAIIGRAMCESASRAAPHPAAPEPDAWSALDAAADAPTDVASRADATRTDEPPARRRPRRLAWAVGAAVLAVGAAVAIVAARGPKPPEPATARPQPADPPLPKREPPGPDFAAERAAAEALAPRAKLRLLFEGEPKPVEVAAGGGLPPGRFTVAAVDFGETNHQFLRESFVSSVFLPAVARLSALVEVRLGLWQMVLSPAHLRAMSAMPLAGTLKSLTARVGLTPESLTDLKKFTALTEVVFEAPEPSNALFFGLSELTRLRKVVFCGPDRRQNLTHEGWDAVAGMRLESVTLFGARGAPDALRAFVARGGPLPVLGFLECRDLTDAALRECLAPTTDVRRLVFRWSDLTDDSVPTLAALKNLQELELQGTKITQRGAEALYKARPELRINYSLKP